MLAKRRVERAVLGAQSAPFPVLVPMIVVYRNGAVSSPKTVQRDKKLFVKQVPGTLTPLVVDIGRHQFVDGKMLTLVHGLSPIDNKLFYGFWIIIKFKKTRGSRGFNTCKWLIALLSS